MLFNINAIFGKAFWDQTKMKRQAPTTMSFAPPQNSDGAAVVNTSGYFGTYLDLDGISRNESSLIERYRDISQYVDVANAIDDIVTEAIVSNDDDVPVKIDTDTLEVSAGLKKKIEQEFENVCRLLDFNNHGADIFRRWYVDGRIYYHKIVDEAQPKRGITELRYLDPRKTRKIRAVEQSKDQISGASTYLSKDEFYVYSDSMNTYTTPNTTSIVQGGVNVGTIQIAPESIASATSGILDLDKNLVLGYLHKAIRPVNHLRMMEDALVIYRMVRAPERRIFYVDVSGMNKVRSEAYMKDLMNRYRNKVVYDASTGEVKDAKKHMTMMEDFWLPRTNSGRGTEISTLPGLQANSLEDVDYFKKNLQSCLNIPQSRMQPEGGIMGFGRLAEITRDELKFAKFIDRLRKRFSMLFDDLLKTQLVLKGIISADDWDSIRYNIKYKFLDDVNVGEQRKIEDIRNKVDMVAQMEQSQFIGKYISRSTAMKRYLGMSNDEIAEEMQLMQQDMQTDMQTQMMQMQMQQEIMGGQPQQQNDESADQRTQINKNN